MRSAVLRSVQWWAGPLLLATSALAFDAAKRAVPFGVWTTGPVDEVAHLCTAALGLLVLARFIRAPRRFYAAALIASVAIDLDHIPLYFGLLENEGQRPVTHSLSTVALFAAAAAASRRHRPVLTGVAAGLVLHFARDIAEGYPGVLVIWPLQDTSWMVGYQWFVGMIVVFTAARLLLVRAGLPRTRRAVFRAPSLSGPGSPDGPTTSGHRYPGPEPERTDLEAACEVRSRTSQAESAVVPSCGVRTAHDRLNGVGLAVVRRRGCRRQAELILPDQIENALRIVRVDGEDMGCPPSGCIRERRRLTELWPGVLIQRRRVHEEHVYPAPPQLERHGVPVFDQERYAEQRQRVSLAGRRGDRIERSKPKHARDPLVAVPSEVAQAAQRPLQMARPLSHPVIRVRRLHPRVELAQVTAGTCVLQPGRAQRHPPWGSMHRAR
jgi:inner membrane protein